MGIINILQGTEIIQAITLALRSEFTIEELPHIYKDKQDFGTVTPFAYVRLVEAQHRNELRDRGAQSQQIEIQVRAPDNATGHETWANKMANRILVCINPIQFCGRPLKPSVITHRYRDSTLIIFASYSYKVIHTDHYNTQPLMKELDVKERMK